MTPSQFLYQQMLRVNESQAREQRPTAGAIISAVGSMYEAIKSGKDSESVRECVVNVAAASLRYAVETAR